MQNKLIDIWIVCFYNVAKMRVYPTKADTSVWPIPQTSAYTGNIWRLDARWTKAIAALLIIPLVIGDTTPITIIKIEKKRPNLCLRNVTNATSAAVVCTKTDENKLHRKIWYHISPNVFSAWWLRRFTTSANVSNFGVSSSVNIVYFFGLNFKTNYSCKFSNPLISMLQIFWFLKCENNSIDQ